jgi:hypothetical protein
MKMLKMLNPLIELWNFFKYMAHLHMFEGMSFYEPYDFTQDTKKF